MLVIQSPKASLFASRPVFFQVFTARCYAQRDIAMANCPSVRLSVCPSVTLRYHGHIGWNSWTIISLLISLTFPPSADPNVTDVLQREHPKF